jgi:DNA-binding FadR family transcriptional regulator
MSPNFTHGAGAATRDAASDPGPIKRTSLVDEIASRIQADILAGRYKPGEALPPERELSERYGVTRTSLKHGLVRLEGLGLIETRHGVGSIVQDVQQSGGADLLKYLVPPDGKIDARFLREMLEARLLIAAAFARLAAKRRKEEDLAKLFEILSQIRRNRDDATEMQRLENLFMRALARASQNRAFILMTNSVSAAYRLSWKTYAEPFKDGAFVERSLAAIYQAVKDKDEAAARRATEAFFEEGAKRILARSRRR